MFEAKLFRLFEVFRNYDSKKDLMKKYGRWTGFKTSKKDSRGLFRQGLYTFMKTCRIFQLMSFDSFTTNKTLLQNLFSWFCLVNRYQNKRFQGSILEMKRSQKSVLTKNLSKMITKICWIDF